MYNNNLNGGGLFNSPFSSSNPLYYGQGNSNGLSNLDQSLLDSYNKMEALKQRQAMLNQTNQTGKQLTTVFTDIANETKDMGEDEMNFVTSSQEYQRLYAKHQQEFSEFITSKFAGEYIQAGNRKNVRRIAWCNSKT